MLFTKNKQKVLVIDDDTSLLRQVCYRLEHREELDVIKATEGKQGLKKALDQNPDLIILDWMLPDIEGIDVLKQLRQHDNTKDIPVLMLTGKNKIGEIDDAFEIGADAYMTKPFSLSALGEKVDSILILNKS